jgi:hypothetical protein
MIGRTNGLIPSLLVYLPWVNYFLTLNKSGSLIVEIMIFLLHLSIPAESIPMETDEA